MKIFDKGVVVFAVLLLVISLSFIVIAADNETDTTAGAISTTTTDNTAVVTKAYNCLKNKVADAGNCKELSAEEQALSLLALAYDETSQQNCQSALNDFSNNDLCWPSTGCRIKETAQAILAKDYIMQDTSSSESWLISKNMTPEDLIWYLQIDTEEASECKVNIDDGQERGFSIDSDKKLSGDAGGCLVRAQDDYWFRISSSCYSRKFTISCEKSFVTNLLYQKENSQTIFVSSKTSQASANGQTEEKVDVRCFGQGTSCDYEGSLWAVLALSKTGHDISSFIPYISAAAADNEKYSPYPFLYYLTAENVYLSNTLGSRLPAKYWQAISSPYSKYYDSALSIMFLYGSGAQEIEESKEYFLSISDNNGCWPSIRDSALLLFAGWPRSAANVDYNLNACEPTYYCMARGDCTAAFGETLSAYTCPSALSICCSNPAVQKTCVEKSGTICSSDQGCAGGSFVISTDSTDRKCCIEGTCQEIPVDDCAGTCKSTCDNGESELSAGICSGYNVCC